MTVYETAGSVRPPAAARSPAALRRWERSYVRAAGVLDAVAAGVASFLAYEVRFPNPAPIESAMYPVLAALMPLIWVGVMSLAGAYDRRFIGVGSEEFRRVVVAALTVIALVGTVSWATRAEIARGYVVIALPVAAVGTVLLRFALRKHVHRLRAAGRCIQRTLVVGHPVGVEDLVSRLGRAAHHGYQVVGVCVPRGERRHVPHQRTPRQHGGPTVVGDLDSVADAVVLTQADTVAVVSCQEMNGSALRRLAWELEPLGADLVVAPALVEVAGPRLSIRPVEGLPLLHLDRPAFSGVRRALKATIDRLLAALALLVLAPVFMVLAAAVKVTSPGPALFRQARVGMHGKEFTILKFRTMVRDAEKRLHEVLHLNEGDGPLFKAQRDPRITPVGAFLRRTSLDELPQLMNVVRGQMSLVGPRPHLAAEVELFGDDMTRRLLVKPGLTGLWQISGRSDLTWDEAVRVDLRYVENWSFMLDLWIIWKTLFVVFRRSGAY